MQVNGKTHQATAKPINDADGGEKSDGKAELRCAGAAAAVSMQPTEEDEGGRDDSSVSGMSGDG